MMGRQFRTRLSVLQPALPHVEKKQQLPKPVRLTKFSNGDHVFIRNYGVNHRVKWVPGRYTSSVGTRMSSVQCADGVHRRHVDQMCHRFKFLPTYSQPPVDEFRFPVATRSATPTPGSPRCETPTRDVRYAAVANGRKRTPSRLSTAIRCSQCRITSASPQHTRSPSAEHVGPLLSHNSKLWRRIVVFSFRLNIVADILSRVTLCRKFAWLRYL